jgi:glycosyltransferase involved in cell wall biosynthesis
MKVLILPTRGFSKGSLYPFEHYAADLKKRFDLDFETVVSDDLKEKIASIEEFDGDIIIFSVPWDFSTEGVLDFAIEANRVKKKAKLVLYDYIDGNESRFWAVMPYIDLYLKQYLHRDMNKYNNRYLGASEFIEYLVKIGKVKNSIRDEVWTNLFQSDLDPQYHDKVILGWNFGLWQRMIYLAEGRANLMLWGKDKLHKRLATLFRQAVDLVRGGDPKPIDVYCRATLYKGWTKAHRTETIRLLNELPDSYNIVSNVQKVGFSEYYREMSRSKIFVSPSGWCEYTPKDYEAMYYGALLVKPDMEHIDTNPDILVPGETYVPVKWDMSDLKEKCLYYLEHPDERERITRNAHEAFVNYYKNREFVNKIEEMLIKLDLLAG